MLPSLKAKDWRSADAGKILFVGDLLEPFDVRAVERFLNRDMGHGGGRRRAVPVLVTGRAPDHVTGADFDDRAALALGPAAPGGDDQGLAERMGMPGAARAGLEGDAGAGDARRFGRRIQRIDANRAGEILFRPFLGGLRARLLLFYAGGVVRKRRDQQIWNDMKTPCRRCVSCPQDRQFSLGDNH